MNLINETNLIYNNYQHNVTIDSNIVLTRQYGTNDQINILIVLGSQARCSSTCANSIQT